MYSMLGDKLNVWIVVILIMGRLGEVIPLSDHIRLGTIIGHTC